MRSATAGTRTARSRRSCAANLVARLRAGEPLTTGVIGYDDTVLPELERAILAGQDLILLGERGQAKTRLVRRLTELLDEHAPIDRRLRDRLLAVPPDLRRAAAAGTPNCGDDLPVAWIDRERRFAEKLATPDTAVADLIGDVDPIKVAEGRTLGDEETIHWGLVPRHHRGIVAINELPDLPERIQVALLNVLEERDVQIRGYSLRLPLDLLLVATANPDDYTNRGRIISPLKDRFGAQVRTHYPRTIDDEVAIVLAEAAPPPPRRPGPRPALPRRGAGRARPPPARQPRRQPALRCLGPLHHRCPRDAGRRRGPAGGPDRRRAWPSRGSIDLRAVLPAALGRIEFDLLDEGGEVEVVDLALRRAVLTVWRRHLGGEDLRELVDRFEERRPRRSRPATSTAGPGRPRRVRGPRRRVWPAGPNGSGSPRPGEGGGVGRRGRRRGGRLGRRVRPGGAPPRPAAEPRRRRRRSSSATGADGALALRRVGRVAGPAARARRRLRGARPAGRRPADGRRGASRRSASCSAGVCPGSAGSTTSAARSPASAASSSATSTTTGRSRSCATSSTRSSRPNARRWARRRTPTRGSPSSTSTRCRPTRPDGSGRCRRTTSGRPRPPTASSSSADQLRKDILDAHLQVADRRARVRHRRGPGPDRGDARRPQRPAPGPRGQRGYAAGRRTGTLRGVQGRATATCSPATRPTLDELLRGDGRTRGRRPRRSCGRCRPDQRRQLEDLARQVFDDLDLQFQLDQLGDNLAAAFPGGLPGAGDGDGGDGDGADGIPDQPQDGQAQRADQRGRRRVRADRRARGPRTAPCRATTPGPRWTTSTRRRCAATSATTRSRDLRQLKAIERELERSGAMRVEGGELELTPSGARQLGQRSLARLLDRVQRQPAAPDGRGRPGTDRPDARLGVR